MIGCPERMPNMLQSGRENVVELQDDDLTLNVVVSGAPPSLRGHGRYLRAEFINIERVDGASKSETLDGGTYLLGTRTL
jgi:hypothetical protein